MLFLTACSATSTDGADDIAKAAALKPPSEKKPNPIPASLRQPCNFPTAKERWKTDRDAIINAQIDRNSLRQCKRRHIALVKAADTALDVAKSPTERPKP